MFDIGFWELVLVGVVALLVFGPERLPRVARETALWVRKARSMVASVKSEIDHELQLQELRQSLLEEKRKIELESKSLIEGRVLTGKSEPAKLAQADAEGSTGETAATERSHEQE
jgi:sec-independent protein translocase protein TatB